MSNHLNSTSAKIQIKIGTITFEDVKNLNSTSAKIQIKDKVYCVETDFGDLNSTSAKIQIRMGKWFFKILRI